MSHSLDNGNGTGREPLDERILDEGPDDDILIDGRLFRAAARRRLRTWAVAGPLLFVSLAAIQLLVMPQKYEVVTSVAVQQGQNLTSPLAAFAGITSTNNKYIGLLESRRLAELVEARYHLQRFYHLSTHEKVMEMLMSSVRPEDNASTGLLLIHITLPGSPRFGPDPDHMRNRVPKLVADVANTYATELTNYFANYDNDRDSELLRAADKELLDARSFYDQRIRIMRAFVHDMGRLGSEVVPDSGAASGSLADSDDSPDLGSPNLGSGAVSFGSGGSGGTGGSGLSSLYEKQIETQAEIAQLQAAEKAEDVGMQRLLGNLEEIPLDDPFLRTARLRVHDARRAYLGLIDGQQLALENPQVVIARNRLDAALTELNRQKEAARQNLTSTRVDVDMKMEGLRAKLATIRGSIRSSERKMPRRRDRSFDQMVMERELDFAAARLKEALVKGAEIRFTAVSGKSRLSVVDPAVRAETGQPSLLRAALISLVLTLLPAALSIVWEYMRQLRQRTTTALRIAAASELAAQGTSTGGQYNGSPVAPSSRPPQHELPQK